MPSRFDPPLPMPDPSKVRPQPQELIVREMSWPRWVGSATEIGRLAAHAENLIGQHFMSFNDPSFRELLTAAQEQAYPEPRQYFVYGGSQIATSRWARGPIKSELLGDEIEARRNLTNIVTITSSVIDRGWPVDIFDQLPHRDRDELSPDGSPIPGSEGSVPPQQIQIVFQRQFPAARLRVLAAGPMACDRLYREIVDRVDAGSRPKVWSERQAGLAGAAVGTLVPLVLVACSVLSGGPAVALLVALAMVGCVVGSSIVPWAFPPLELVDAWEKSRWQKLKTWAFQFLTLAFAVGGIIVAIALAAPSH